MAFIWPLDVQEEGPFRLLPTLPSLSMPQEAKEASIAASSASARQIRMFTNSLRIQCSSKALIFWLKGRIYKKVSLYANVHQ